METIIGIVYYILTISGGREINMNGNLGNGPAGSPKPKWADNIKIDNTEITELLEM